MKKLILTITILFLYSCESNPAYPFNNDIEYDIDISQFECNCLQNSLLYICSDTLCVATIDECPEGDE